MMRSENGLLSPEEISHRALHLAQKAAAEFEDNSKLCLHEFRSLLEDAAVNPEQSYDPTAVIVVDEQQTSLYAAVHKLSEENSTLAAFEKEIEWIFPEQTALANDLLDNANEISASTSGSSICDDIPEEALLELDKVKDSDMYQVSAPIKASKETAPKKNTGGSKKSSKRHAQSYEEYNRIQRNHYLYK